MLWKSLGHSDLLIGGKPVLIRSLLLSNETGNVHRYRVCSQAGKPVWAKLAKDSSGKIGALVTGPYSEFFEIPSLKEAQPYLFVPLNSLSKRVRKKLLIPLNYELCEEGNTLVAKERQNEPYYIASSSSSVFHYPGCRIARKVLPHNRISFKTRNEALNAHYRPHRICSP